MIAPSFSKLTISNPKRHADLSDESRLFPYYAGYSSAFTSELLKSATLSQDALVVDPWNGAGTTTAAAKKLGLKAIGIDLNPAMVIVAKATLLSASEGPSLFPLAESMIEQCKQSLTENVFDPLTKWIDETGS